MTTVFYALFLLPNLSLLALDLRSISGSEFRTGEWVIESSNNVITIRGKLEFGIADAFQSEVQNTDPSLIALDSFGGVIEEANRISAVIESRGLSTAVVGECLSACTTIFAAGSERIMLANANIGFHSARYLFNQQGAVASSYPEVVYQTLIQKGFPEAMVDQIAATPPEEMWFAPTMPLIESGFITHVAADLYEARSFIDGVEIDPNTLREFAPPLGNSKAMVTLSFGQAQDTSVSFPFGKDLVAITPRDELWSIFDAMTFDANRLLLVLIPQTDAELLREGLDGLGLFARVEQISPGTRVSPEEFDLLRGYMLSHYQDMVHAIQKRIPQELQKGAQRLSQTTRSDIRMGDFEMTSLDILDDSDRALVVQIEMSHETVVEGEAFESEQVLVQSMVHFEEAIVAINWYESKDENGEVYEVHSRANESLRMLGASE